MKENTLYDYLIIGCGIFGSVFARELTNHGYKCLIIDKRNHIAGNCYTHNYNGINIHKYGPHIFHTNNETIWNYINQFGKFNNYYHRPKVNYKDKIYSFPINLLTLYQLWNVKTPEEAKLKLNEVKINNKQSNFEEWILSQVGEEIYKTFFYGYTLKQWEKHPSELPADIIKRIPIRLTYEDNYFFDKYQGIPIEGYTKLFTNLLDGIDVELEIDYFNKRDYWNSIAKRIVYTGAIDEFFDMQYGELEWRSLFFENEILHTEDYQGCAIVNYTSEDIKYTRITEHKHFNNITSQKLTIISKEYPLKHQHGREKFYPINDTKNNNLFKKYQNLIDKKKFIFGGRLAEYIYYDMHQVIGSALKCAKQELNKIE